MPIAFLSAFCQKVELLDSLRRQLPNEISDSLKVEILNELSWQLRKSDRDQALSYAYHAEELAKQKGLKGPRATALNRLGEIRKLSGEYDKAVAMFRDALTIERTIGNQYGVARALNQLCIVNKNLGNYSDAIKQGTESLEIFKSLGKLSNIALGHNALANAYKQMGDYEKALIHAENSLEIRVKVGKKKSIAHSYTTVALLNKRLGDFQSSIDLLFKALSIWQEYGDEFEAAKTYTNIANNHFELNNYDSAITYNLKSLFIKDSLGFQKRKDVNFNNLGVIYGRTNSPEKALTFFKKGLQIKRDKGDLDGVSFTLNNLGNTLYSLNQYEEALDAFEEGLALAKTSKSKAAELELLKGISDTYLKLDQYKKSIEYSNRYIDLKDSVDNLVQESIAVRRELDKEKNRIEILERETKISIAESERKSILIYSLLTMTALLIVLFFYIYRSNRLKQLALIADKNEKISRQKVDQLLKDQELATMNAMLDGKEGERKRIAQDLHDRLGSMLSMVKVHFQSVEENLEEIRKDNLTQYEKANSLLDEACEEVRKIAHDMNSGVLSKFGIMPALEDLKRSLESSGKIIVNILGFGFEEDRLSYDVEISIYRIIQELLSNILKHSKASEITVQLIKKDNNLNVVVEDNGVGFEWEKRTMGMGFASIEARLNKMDGEFMVDSGKGSGTTVTLNVPLTLSHD